MTLTVCRRLTDFDVGLILNDDEFSWMLSVVDGVAKDDVFSVLIMSLFMMGETIATLLPFCLGWEVKKSKSDCKELY